MTAKGIHNIFIVIPQFLSTGISSFVFALLDDPKGAGDKPRSHTLFVSLASAGHSGAKPMISAAATPNPYAVIFR
jgi:hypothetical protein